MEPIFLEPVYKEILWGGQGLNKIFDRNLPYEKTAESWEICAHKNGINLISNGEYNGVTLEELFAKDNLRTAIFGTKCTNLEKFPILNKFIDANDSLSIQVHPDDDYAIKNANDLGKTEMWYIVDTKPNAQLIYGAKPNITKEQFKQSILDGNPQDNLNYVTVKKGDVIFIPARNIACNIRWNYNL